MPQTTHYSPDADIAANTEIDLSDVLDEPFDLRDGHDPISSAHLKKGSDDTSQAGTEVFSTTALASQGQGAADDPAAGEVVVTGPTSVALGDPLNANSFLQLAADVKGQSERSY